MQLSAPCRIVEMTAECLGLEYQFKVCKLAPKLFGICWTTSYKRNKIEFYFHFESDPLNVYCIGCGPHDRWPHEAWVPGNESHAQHSNCQREAFKWKVFFGTGSSVYFVFWSFWDGFCPIDISYDNELKHFLLLLEGFKKMETSSWMNQGLWLPTWSTSMARMIVCTQRHVQCVCHKTFTIICNFFQDPEVRARVDQKLYFDMGVFYKVKLQG